MTRKNIFLFVAGLLSLEGIHAVRAQNPDWSSTVANIIYNNCSSCHHPGTAAPFSLLSYQNAVDQALAIQEAVVDKHMPPWPADPEYRHFAYEAVLEQNQIDAIDDWVNNGMPIGDTSLEPLAPVFNNTGSQLSSIDYVVAIEPYTLQSNSDEYRWFVMPTNFTDTVYVHQIEVMPGLSLVHHADLAYDVTGNSLTNDLADPLPGFNGSTGGPTYSYYMNAWMAGSNVVTYPENWGIMIPPGADFVMEIHYGPGGIGLVDSSKINLRFVTNPDDVRPVSAQWLLNHGNMTDGPLVIPANQVKTFHHASAPLTSDKSVISICPHMHYLGKSFRVWYVNPSGDSVPLVNIPHWDFHWQKYYTFPTIEKIPAGSVIHSEGVYDNTIDNEHNPNNPPQTVTAGLVTESEMFMCYFIMANYETGDENIVMDTTLLNIDLTNEQHESLRLFPNPAFENVVVVSDLLNDNAVVTISDLTGRVVRTFVSRERDGNLRLDLNDLVEGCYHVSIKNSKSKSTASLIILRN